MNRFPDGTSNTMMFATRYASRGTTVKNGNGLCSNYDVLAGTAQADSAATSAAFMRRAFRPLCPALLAAGRSIRPWRMRTALQAR